MANDYYGRDRDFIPFTRARGDDVQFELDALEAAFDKLPSESRVLSGNSNFVTAGGTANSITVSAPTTWTGYSGKDGYRLSIKITTANTGTVTLSVDGLGAKSCVRLDGDALAADDLQVNGIYDFFYNNSTGKFHVAAWNSFVTDAEAARDAAQTAQGLAESARDDAQTAESNASSSATTASNYATKTDGFASGSDNSAKSWAVGGSGDGQPSAGPAKDWATKAEDSTVDGVDYSAFHWSKKAEAWAASVNLPNITGNALKILRAKADESGHEYIGGEDVLFENTSGAVIQNAFTSTGAVISTTNSIPYDDTIPQITEGAEALSVNFTPKRADSRIRVTANLQVRGSIVDKIRTAAIFLAGANDAIAVASSAGDVEAGVPGLSGVIVVGDMASPGMSSQTISARFGMDGSGTAYLNGNSSGDRRYGGVFASTLEIMEYMP